MYELYNKSSENQIYNFNNAVIVTDPPFNIGYHYENYKDNMPIDEYKDFIKDTILSHNIPFVIIHYPEFLHEISIMLGQSPTRIVSWVYNSNTAKQHRDIAFWGIKPDFNKVKQPYKNPNDKRIKERIARGCTGARLYDWWNVNQVKNVAKEKTQHPCQMPLEVMNNIIGILPDEVDTIIDPFMGSGTTGVAALSHNKNFVGYEVNHRYFGIARKRIHEQWKK